MATREALEPASSSTSMTTIPVLNPATGQEVGMVPATPREEVAEVVARGRTAQRAWAVAPFSERAAVLRRFHDTMLDEADRVLDTIQLETGKTRRDALAELVTVAGTVRYYLTHGENHLRDRKAHPAVPGLTSAKVTYKPLGVAGLITPWNYPLLLPVGDAVAGVLAGNALVVKPDEKTPLSTELGRELLIASGLHPDLFQVIHGDGAVVGQELVRHVDYIGFTGSTEIGRKVAVAASDRLIPHSLELGGKNPMVILADAPIEDAVTGFLAGAFANTGQTCIATEKIYVERPAYERFVERLVARIEAMEIGFALDYSKDMGSLISEEHTAKVMTFVREAVDKGATVVTGGKALPELGPTFVQPTVLADTDPSMELHCEETFGPVVSIQPVESAEEAVADSNGSRYGLNASVWSRDSGRARQIARRLETGSAGVNSTLLIYNSFDVPMGGVKASGLGRRHSKHGIRRYTQEQSIVESFSTGGGYESILTRTDTGTKAKALISAFRLWRKIPFIR